MMRARAGCVFGLCVNCSTIFFFFFHVNERATGERTKIIFLLATAGLSKSCPEPDPTHRIEFSVNRDDFEVVCGVLGVDGKCAREIEAYVGLLEKHVSNLGEKWHCMTLLATCPRVV